MIAVRARGAQGFRQYLLGPPAFFSAVVGGFSEDMQECGRGCVVTATVSMAMWLSVGDYVPEYGESGHVSVPPNVAMSLSVHLRVQCISVCVDGHSVRAFLSAQMLLIRELGLCWRECVFLCAYCAIRACVWPSSWEWLCMTPC